MANFIDCTTNSFSLETIIGSMFSKIEGARVPLIGFRIEKHEQAGLPVIECDNFVSWVELFMESLALDLNGNATLRVNIVKASELEEGDIYQLATACDSWETTLDLFKQSFCELEDGNKALLLIDTTPPL